MKLGRAEEAAHGKPQAYPERRCSVVGCPVAGDAVLIGFWAKEGVCLEHGRAWEAARARAEAAAWAEFVKAGKVVAVEPRRMP